MSDLILRPATACDVPDIARIWNDIIATTTITFTTETVAPEHVSAQIAARGEAFQVAIRQKRLLGFATYAPFRSGPGYAHTMEHTIHLAPEAQGKGVGKALLARLGDVAARDGVHVLIGAISGENTRGIGFHAAMGFAEVGRLPEVGHKFGRRLDLVLMQKILDLPH